MFVVDGRMGDLVDVCESEFELDLENESDLDPVLDLVGGGLLVTVCVVVCCPCEADELLLSFREIEREGLELVEAELLGIVDIEGDVVLELVRDELGDEDCDGDVEYVRGSDVPV